MKKAEKFVYIGYILGISLVLFVLIYMIFNIKDDVYSARTTEKYRLLTPERFLTITDSAYPAGAYNECVFTLTDIPSSDSQFIFYTSHEAVEIYIDGELIFRLSPDAGNAFSKTSGSNWNSIPLYRTDEGKTMRILLIPLYGNVLDVCPDFYLGSQLQIWLHLIGSSMTVFVLALLAVLIGCIFILYSLITFRNKKIDKKLMMMGAFSVFIGLWKITDLEITTLLFPARIPLTYVTYFSLMVVVIPFVLFVKEIFTEKDNFLWYIPCFANLLVLAAVMFLQLAGISDIRENLWMIHLVMLSIVPVVVIMIIRELKKYGWNKKLRMTFICMGSCLIGLLADVAIYYASRGTKISILGMLGFLVYIMLFGISSFKNAKQLMSIGRQAKRFEEMAYHDQLTGLYNRTAYADYTGRAEFNPENHIVVMFDLNNLKKCNDTFGHEQGDCYITTSARLIQQHFGESGGCYRMGGDEFCALLHDVPLSKCAEYVLNFKNALEKHNAAHADAFPIHIACGYELYDASVDYDIGDTLRRADKMMYSEKFAMKQKSSEEIR